MALRRSIPIFRERLAEPIVQMAVTWDSANRKKDKSVSLRFTTNVEVSNADFAEMDRLVGNEGWVLFKGNEFKPTDLPKEPAPTDVGKQTKSQQLRWMLMRVHEHKNITEPFDTWYPKIMDKIIDRYGQELD